MDWNKLASGMLKAELKRRNISYEQLVTLLNTIDVHETHASILNKMSRGAFQFAFFLQCAAAIGITNLRLDDLAQTTPDAKSRS
ncbi:DUF6471 domain-containing protein [Legionella pneumophila]|uniref:DUF6471 domain-containing protein n=1 Tax=Legionella pneumophila TaxID=446 RepID=UPI001A214856|nr:hypothetical protein [Legionella pneumophila subsp. pneumophila]HAU9810056.1 hypothetical protein [Legionella pneumophila]HAU9905590.1 hypothetical protein [Legionella pneumophila]HAU9927036.1 hypothetical protein [Legionella pneumophila]HAU9930823.1 hypothetical protein [Legionella pneumophila]